MYIGQLSRLTGASPRAIRLYEAMKLLKVSRVGSYRVYDQSHVEFVLLIKEAQRLGVLLTELQQLQRSEHTIDWQALQQLLAQKAILLQQQISELHAEQLRLAQAQQLIAECFAREQARCATAA